MKVEKTIRLKRMINICDICKDREAKHICFICGKDLCHECVIFEEDSEIDFPGKYCQSCWDAGERFRKEIEKIAKWHKEEAFAMRELWKENALKEK